MNKKILLGLIALTLVIPSTSHANVKNRTVSVPTLAILDTGLDTSVPSIKEKLIYEVCISYYGRTYEEGKKIVWKDGFRAIYCIFKYKFVK